MNTTLILLSGGIDSAVCLAIAAARGDRTQALFIDYGQEARLREESCSQQLAAHPSRNTRWAKLHLPLLQPLTPERPYVPDRNAAFLLAALATAREGEADRVWIGSNAGDRHQFPDATAAFLRQAARVYTRISGGRVTLEAPLIHLEKPEVLRMATRLDIPRDATWSCYRAGPSPCGECRACRQQAGLQDCRCTECAPAPTPAR